ncbi:MAG: cation-translocating P-type ATPase [Candidatus Coproplasma sp.]
MLSYSFKTAERTLKELESDEHGLSEVQARSRLLKYGANAIEKRRKVKPITLFFAQFKDVMTLLLIAAAAISAVIAVFSRDMNDVTDTLIILTIILLNAIVGTVQQYRADKAIEGLKKLSTPYACALRDGKAVKIPAAELTLGDVVLLEEGDLVPADCRIISSVGLKADEAALTGEAEAVEKRDGVITDRSTPLGNTYNMLFSSTFIVHGNARAVVTGVGRNTQIGAIADMLEDEEKGKTPLEKSLDKLGKIISAFVVAVAAVVFIIGACNQGGVLKSFMTAVAVAVAAIPEGLPAVVTIIMAMGVRRMAGQNVVIRKLKVVETLGGCTCICTDKTGTLTRNQMQVEKVWLPHSTGVNSLLLACMTACNNARGNVGDPTETALLRFSEGENFSAEIIRTGEIPFSSERKMMSVGVEYVGKKWLFCKGAPDVLIKKCTRITEGGVERELTEYDRNEIFKVNAQMSDGALRVLAFAYAHGDGLREENLTFIGLCGLADGLKPGVKRAVEECERAGIATVMITGDHACTAFAVAKQAGICRDERLVFSGEQLDAMNKKQRAEAIKRGRVFARVTPAHKNLIVKIKKRAGEVVAMTGDGVNDAPPIKSADIGVAMGVSGTDVTKSVADMVIADDNFTTIVSAVREGRRISSNVKKTICFFLSTNLAEVIAILIAAIAFSGRDFLLSTQLLWINLITDSFPVLALGVEKGDPDAMSRPPERAEKAVLNGRTLAFILCSGAYISAVTVGLYAFALAKFGNAAATTLVFISVSFSELFHAFNVRAENKSAFCKGALSNKVLLATVFCGVAVNVALCFSPLSTAFGIVNLTAAQWALAFGVSLSVIPFCEVYKLITRLIEKRKRSVVES